MSTTARATGRQPSQASAADARSEPSWRRYLKIVGPGVVTGASDDDPSGIATYAQAGAQFRFGFLWAALLTLPMMAGVQEICDRTALATGRSLGSLAVRRFARVGRAVVGVLLIALVVANALNIAADLAVIGDGAHLLHAGPSWLWALLAGAGITAFVITGSFELVSRVFKYLCLALVAYVAELAVVNIPWGTVATNTFVPHIRLSADYLALLVAVLGTTISPYLFFWQSAHRVEEMREEPRGGDRPVPLKQRPSAQARFEQRASRADVFAGMGISNVVMFAIIAATAATLGAHGKHDINTAAEAAAALKPVAGQLSSILFSLGIVGAGALAVPVLAGSGSAGLAGLLGKDWGFSRSPHEAPVFYGLVMVGTLGGTLLTLLGINTIRLLVIVALVNGFAAFPFLVVVMLISSDRKIMGKYRNGRLALVVGWLTAGLMAAAAVALIATGGGM